MRRAAIVLALSVLAACGGGGGGSAAPATTATAATSPPVVDDVEFVRQAVEATRKAGTAAFTIEGVTTIAEGDVSLRRQGHYDLGSGTAALEQTFSSDPPELLDELTGEKNAAEITRARTVVTGKAVYLQMPAWPAPKRTKWLRFRADRVDREAAKYGVALSTDVFPAMLDILTRAKVSPKDKSGRSRVPPYAEVLVPAKDAFLAFPSNTIRELVSAGADPEKLEGDVDVTVEVDKGVVTMVTYDIAELLDQAYSQIGRGGAAGTLEGVGATLYLSDHGKPVKITVPTDAQVMSANELRG